MENETSFKLRELLEDKELNYLYQVKEKSMRLKDMLKGHNESKLSGVLDKVEDMTPEVGKRMGRPDLGKVGRKGWEAEVIKKKGSKSEAAAKEDRVSKKKEGDDDLKRVDKDADVSGPLRRWAEPTKITTTIKEAEEYLEHCSMDHDDEDSSASGDSDDDDGDGKDDKLVKEGKKEEEPWGPFGTDKSGARGEKDPTAPNHSTAEKKAREAKEKEQWGPFGTDSSGARGEKDPTAPNHSTAEKKKKNADAGTMGNEPKIAEVLRTVEDMTPEVGKRMKRDDLGRVGRKGWEKEIKTDGTAPKVTKGESRLKDAMDKANKLQKIHGDSWEEGK